MDNGQFYGLLNFCAFLLARSMTLSETQRVTLDENQDL